MDINEELKDPKYSEAYSETKLFNKIVKFAKAAGTKAIYLALLLFYTLQQSTTPKWAKSVIIGALGYFILPLDFIPDFVPIAGFSDDVTALLSAFVAVAMYVNPETKAKARARMQVWFGSYDETKLDEIDRKIEE
ncbi:MAG: DUF1232 domain-containing protein [Erysipelotrichaceae bacterium]|nr:DUF1232 domain-containing protein [Erysipelotrichaceae bacterium]